MRRTFSCSAETQIASTRMHHGDKIEVARWYHLLYMHE